MNKDDIEFLFFVHRQLTHAFSRIDGRYVETEYRSSVYDTSQPKTHVLSHRSKQIIKILDAPETSWSKQRPKTPESVSHDLQEDLKTIHSEVGCALNNFESAIARILQTKKDNNDVGSTDNTSD